MVLSSFNTFGNITNSVKPPSSLPPNLSTLYSLGTVTKVSTWGNPSSVDTGYTYQLDKSTYNWNASSNPNTIPSTQGYAMSEDGNTIAFPVKKFNGASIVSFGILVSDNSGSTWSFVDLSNSTCGSQRVRSMTASASCDVIYLWTATCGNATTDSFGGNQYICKWTSSYGPIRTTSNWKFGDGSGNGSTIQFMPPTYAASRTAQYGNQYGNITTDYSGNVLYMLQTITGPPIQTILTYASNAKTTDPSGGWISKYTVLSNGPSAFWSKISGDGNVLWWMNDARVVYCGLINSSYVCDISVQCIATGGIGGDANFSPNTQHVVSYDGKNCICNTFNRSSGIFQWFKVSISYSPARTLTLDLSSITTAPVTTNVYTASGNTLKTTSGTLINGIGIGYIDAIAMCNNSAYPYLIMGTCADATGSRNEYTNKIILAKSYIDISTNYAGGAIGTTNSTTFKEAKTIDTTDKYVVGVSISPTTPLVMLLTTTGVDVYNGTISSYGGSLYRLKPP